MASSPLWSLEARQNARHSQFENKRSAAGTILHNSSCHHGCNDVDPWQHCSQFPPGSRDASVSTVSAETQVAAPASDGNGRNSIYAETHAGAFMDCTVAKSSCAIPEAIFIQEGSED